MTSAVADVRLALRLLRRSPASTAIALLSIALSVGATAVVFAAVKSVLLDPLPFARPNELVFLRGDAPDDTHRSVGDWVILNDAIEVVRRTSTLASVATFSNAVFDIGGDAGAPPESHYGVQASANLFDTLGVSPMLGRGFRDGEDRPGRPAQVVLSYGLWSRRFHSDPNIVGRNITVGAHDCLVLGVMPQGFNFPMRREAAHTPAPYVEFWSVPFLRASNPKAGAGAVARLRPGISLAEARQDLAAISRDLAHDFPVLNRDRVLSLNTLRDRSLGSAPNSLLLLMAAAALFMLIGCANVANLLLARGVMRQREMAIRVAIGAPYARILRQLLTEGCVLAVLGGLAGYGLTLLAWQALPALSPTSIPRLAAARADTTVLAFALVIALGNGILFGIFPALRLSGAPSRLSASARRDRVRSTLITAEIALAVLLVVVGGQVLTAFVRLISTDPGFQADRVLASVLLASTDRYPIGSDKRELFYRRVLDQVRTIPGVESDGVVDALPFSGENHGGFVSSENSPARITAEIDAIGGDYLPSLGIRLLEGRSLAETDQTPASTAVLVDQFLARRLWPTGSAIGRRLCLGCTLEKPNNWRQVVGVVSNSSHIALDAADVGNVYLAAGGVRAAQFLVVRTSRPAREMETSVRRAVASLDPNQPIFLTATMRELVSDSSAGRRFLVVLLGITGCLALLMSAAGVYGVASYTTSRRTREFGIRMAVGATPAHILSLVFREGFRTVTIGVALGLTTAALALTLLRHVIPGLESVDAGAVLTATFVVTATATLACLLPARRATRTNPIAALRED